MKTLVFLLIILMAISCTSKEEVFINKKVIIAGKIINPDPEIYKIIININRIGFGNETYSPILKDDGSFKISFDSYIPTDAWLLYKMNLMNFLILTHPGDSIYVEFDGSSKENIGILKTIKFSGDAERINQEAIAFQIMYGKFYNIPSFLKRQQIIKEYDAINFRRYMDSVKTEMNSLYHKFQKEINPSKETQNWAKTFLDVQYYRDLTSYPNFHLAANHLSDKDWSVPISYYDFLKDPIHINESKLISGYALKSYINFYPVYLHEIMREENKLFFSSLDTIKKYPGKMDSLMFFSPIRHISDPILRQMVLTEILNQFLESSDIRMFEKYNKEVNSYITETYLKEPLDNQYKDTKERIDKPIFASESTLNKLNGTTVKSCIDILIKANKGKVIYVDCWATWCGPCIGEIPNSKKLMSDFKNKNVAFVYICLDSDEKIWKSIISKYEIGGNHLFLNKKQSADFRQVFVTIGLPHYILFDKNGNIFENGTLRPLEIKDKLDNLLEQ
jgi:thiol-disulfide isomerase/thioredoxin